MEFPDSKILSERYLKLLENEIQIDASSPLDPRLLIGSTGTLETFYAPFDHINGEAKVVIVGLTPGRQQMQIAISEFQRRIRERDSFGAACERAKNAASFGGPMRANLSAMLDSIRLNEWLAIPSCASLFFEHQRLVHCTSVLRYPVFRSKNNYSGSPSIIKSEFLFEQVLAWFASELDTLRNCVFVPLGDEVHSTLLELARSQLVDETKILGGLPHPSGANAERIAFFLERKEASRLSPQTNASKIEAARQRLMAKVKSL